MYLDELTKRQRVSLWLDGHSGLYTTDEAMEFMKQVAVALRYTAGNDVPLASMYRATQRQVPVPEDEKQAHVRAFDLTNKLLASGRVVEITLVANRLALADEGLMPAIYTLRRRDQQPLLSPDAREAFDFIGANEGASSGEVRRHLKAEGQQRPDRADVALGELQRELLIDRGPSSGTSRGIFYLSREGYPYRVLARSHPEIPPAAARLSRAEAALTVVTKYLAAALFATPRKLQSLFQLLLSGDEIQESVLTLREHGQVELSVQGRNERIIYQGG